MKKTIKIVPYNPDWPHIYEKEVAHAKIYSPYDSNPNHHANMPFESADHRQKVG